ncbi:MAG: SURF1 family protein [Hyphomicrobiales bacterium]|nr:SURF1 family protein [Hyphomicrobiales bacterium]
MSVARKVAARSIVGPAIAATIAFGLLCGLGVWQVERLHWKEGVLARIDARIHQPAGALPPEAAWSSLKSDDYDYAHVSARGRFVPGREALIFRSGSPNRDDQSAGPGYQVLTPLKLDTGGVVLVDRGFAPLAWKDDPAIRTPPPDGDVEVTGLMRPPEGRNLFTPADQPADNLWFTRDPAGMAKEFGLAAVAPFTIDQDAAPGMTRWPHPGATELNIPNNHLSYALTWFGLAATLAVFFGVWVVRGRDPATVILDERETFGRESGTRDADS